MRVDPHPNAVCYPKITSAASIKTSLGEQLILDQAAKLEQGRTVAVFLNGCFMLVGRLLRRPVPHRHLVIGYRDVDGSEGVTSIFGLRDEHTQVWRVTGVVREI
jgi:hypothetical protein